MKDFELIFYKKGNGECPVSDFLKSLDKVMRFKLMHSMDLLELYGNRPKGDISRFVKDGIFELRAQTRTDITRILFFFGRDRKIVLTHGFQKKTQRMPLSELETAMRYRADYLAREGERGVSPQEIDPEYRTVGPAWRPRLDDIVSDAQGKHAASTHSRETDARGR